MADIDAYVGIDLSFRKGKPLPVSVCVKNDGILIPLPLREKHLLPPKGKGNLLALDETLVEAFSREVLQFLRKVEESKGVRIEMIAIDAPRNYKTGLARRQCEKAMDDMGISCFATPSLREFDEIREKVKKHMVEDGRETHIPHANQLWMLVGFSLFRTLGKAFGQNKLIEVYPQAIVNALECSELHKTTEDGFLVQLRTIAKATGWISPDDFLCELNKKGYGAKHDKLDAFMSAWVASLPVDARKACGAPPDDVIWVPEMEKLDYDKH